MAKKITPPTEPSEVDIYAATLIGFDDNFKISMEDFIAYAEFNDIDKCIIDVLKADSNLLSKATPRQWFMASKVVARQRENPSADIIFLALLSGTVGKENADAIIKQFNQ